MMLRATFNFKMIVSDVENFFYYFIGQENPNFIHKELLQILVENQYEL